MSKKRVIFDFDERSVRTYEQMREEGLMPDHRLAARLHREATIESLQAQVAQLRRDLGAAESALSDARETNRRLNRRVQLAESAANEKIRNHPTPGSLGRALANYAAASYRRERDGLAELLAADTPAQEGKTNV